MSYDEKVPLLHPSVGKGQWEGFYLDQRRERPRPGRADIPLQMAIPGLQNKIHSDGKLGLTQQKAGGDNVNVKNGPNYS